MKHANTTTHDRLALGIDIGGTRIKMGLVTSRGEILATDSTDTGSIDCVQEFERVAQALVRFISTAGYTPEQLCAVGLDVPGVVLNGKLKMAPNISLNLDGLLKELHSLFSRAQFATLNDANAAALGETWVGAGEGVDSLAMLVLGTGVGAGVVEAGKVVVGCNGAAGEIGHLCVNYDEDETCGCGCKGCLEQYSSARGLIRLYKEECRKAETHEVTIEHATDALAIFEAARSGDLQARMACVRLGHYLARALASIATTIDPAVFVIGGGMCGGWDTFGQACEEEYRIRAIPDCKQTPIRVAALGNTAAFLGSAYAGLTMSGI